MSDKTDKEILESKDDLEMMRRPHLWPHSPVLPMKRPLTPGVRGLGLAVLLADMKSPHGEEFFIFIPEVSLYEIVSPGFTFKGKKVEYFKKEDLQEILDRGWTVD